MFLSEWREFPSAPWLAGGKKTWWQLASRCCWNRARPWHASELVSFLIGLRLISTPVHCLNYSVPRHCSCPTGLTSDCRVGLVLGRFKVQSQTTATFNPKRLPPTSVLNRPNHKFIRTMKITKWRKKGDDFSKALLIQHTYSYSPVN